MLCSALLKVLFQDSPVRKGIRQRYSFEAYSQDSLTIEFAN